MISFEEASKIIFSGIPKAAKETVPLKRSPGRILATAIVADADMPPFSRSAMDGYACRRSDVDRPLKIIEEIPAGNFPLNPIAEGQCARIMTGAPIPEGADVVIRVEDTYVDQEGYVVIREAGANTNIRYRGEDVEQGDVLIPAGTLIRKQHVGIMATVGVGDPEVFLRPRVGVISTGSELVPLHEQPGPSQIRNSNGPQLGAQLSDLGIEANHCGIVADNEELITERIREAVDANDVVLISGGVSAGDYDFVPDLLSEMGFDILFHKMKVRPGKPLLFARKEDKFVFGVPGNPVSTFVQFEVLIRPFLYAWMGRSRPVSRYRMPMGRDLKLNPIPLRYFIPVLLDESGVVPVEYHGSGHLASYIQAEGILDLPANTESLTRGELVDVILL